jgi:hypothetical protein
MKIAAGQNSNPIVAMTAPEVEPWSVSRIRGVWGMVCTTNAPPRAARQACTTRHCTHFLSSKRTTGESPGISIGLNLAKAKISDKKHQTRGRRLLLPSQRPDVVVAEGPQARLVNLRGRKIQVSQETSGHLVDVYEPGIKQNRRDGMTKQVRIDAFLMSAAWAQSVTIDCTVRVE